MKHIAVWLAKEDENKFLQNYAKQRKNINIIWKMGKDAGSKV